MARNKTSETIVFDEPNAVTIEERERPTPDADEVLIRTERTLVSTGTELTVLSAVGPANESSRHHHTEDADEDCCEVHT